MVATAVAEEKILTDEDMPPLDSLNEDSDYSGFLSSGVSEALRRRALRKLFTSAVFNVRDGLDDYDDDFTSFAALGDVVTSDMKHEAEMEARRAGQARPDSEPETSVEEEEVRAAGEEPPGQAGDDAAVLAQSGRAHAPASPEPLSPDQAGTPEPNPVAAACAPADVEAMDDVAGRASCEPPSSGNAGPLEPAAAAGVDADACGGAAAEDIASVETPGSGRTARSPGRSEDGSHALAGTEGSAAAGETKRRGT